MKLNNVSEEYFIYGMLFSLSNRLQTYGDKELGVITLKQQFLLIALEMFEQPPTLKEMGKLLGCSYQNIKRMAEQLQKNEYLAIEKDKKDKRKLLLIATDKAKAKNDICREEIGRFMNKSYNGISRDDLVITLKTLQTIDDNISEVID